MSITSPSPVARHRSIASVVLAITTAVMLASCGGAGTSLVSRALPDGSAAAASPAFPLDAIQPWEKRNAAGMVVPGPTASQRLGWQTRGASAVTSDTEFATGAERFLDGHSPTGKVTASGSILTLESAQVDDNVTTWAMYRLPLGGAAPGVVTADINLKHQQGASGASSYFLGVADYASKRWLWHGPFVDGQARLSLAQDAAGKDYTSGLGNVYVAVVVRDGAACDVVGIGVDQQDAADTTAPPVPTGLTATAVASGLELAWNGMVAADLAGYRIYYSPSAFTQGSIDNRSPVKVWDLLENRTRCIIPGVRGYNACAVAAVDFSGNISGISDLGFAQVTNVGAPPALEVVASTAEALRGLPVQLTATGAASYDWDLDGNGVFEVTGDTSGLQAADTSVTGLIRPAVRATGPADPTAVAMGGISLLITGNTRPVVSATAAPQTGVVPLDVDFNAEADDAEDAPGSLTLAWDFDGDGVFETGTNDTSPSHTYAAAGIFNAKVRVTDSQGAWAVDTLGILATDVSNTAPTVSLTATPQGGQAPITVDFTSGAQDAEDAAASLSYEWDFDGDGTVDLTDNDPAESFNYPAAGVYNVKLKVTDTAGAVATDTVTLVFTGNIAPSVTVTGTPQSGQAPIDVDFTATAQDAEDAANQLTYDWDFDGDGVTDFSDNQPTAQFNFAAAGAYNVKVTVTDTSGARATDGMTVVFSGNTAPTAYLMATPQTGQAPVSIDLDAGGGDAEDPANLTYDWDYDGDGTMDQTTTTSAVTHMFSAAGVYNVKVRVTDPDGASVIDTAAITLTGNTAPTIIATASPQSGNLPLTVDFSAVASDAEDAAGSLTYAWDLDGGGVFDTGVTSATPSKLYTSQGLYNVRARVTDTDGAWAEYTLAINVYAAVSQPPTAVLSVAAQPIILPGNIAYNYDGSASTDPEGDTLRFDWDFDGDSIWDVYDGPDTLTRNFASVGTYISMLRVTDPSNNLSTATQTVYVPSVWNTVHGQPGFSMRHSPFNGPGAAGSNTNWSFNPGGGFQISACPIIGPDGTIYAISSGSVYALQDDGDTTPTVKWSYPMGDASGSGLTMGPDGTIYFAGIDDVVYAIADNGTTTPTVKWTYNVGSQMQSSPAIGPDGTIYIGAIDQKLYALKDNGTSTPTLRWTFLTGDWILCDPLVGPDGTVYIGSNDDTVYALRDNGSSTPTVLWSFLTGGDVECSPTLGSNGRLYVGDGGGHHMYCLAPNGTPTPTVIWTHNAGGSSTMVSSPALSPDETRVYFGIGSSSGLRALNTTNGATAWTKTTSNSCYSDPVVDVNGRIYVVDSSGHLYGLNSSGTTFMDFTVPFGSCQSGIAIGTDGRLYFGSLAGHVFSQGP